MTVWGCEACQGKGWAWFSVDDDFVPTEPYMLKRGIPENPDYSGLVCFMKCDGCRKYDSDLTAWMAKQSLDLILELFWYIDMLNDEVPMDRYMWSEILTEAVRNNLEGKYLGDDFYRLRVHRDETTEGTMFVTSDGYRLTYERGKWKNSDMTFADRYGRPIADNGEYLLGDFDLSNDLSEEIG
jgi:hypothetical protein